MQGLVNHRRAWWWLTRWFFPTGPPPPSPFPEAQLGGSLRRAQLLRCPFALAPSVAPHTARS